MNTLKAILNTGIEHNMPLSQKSRIKILNASLLTAATNIVLYNLLFLLFAKPLIFDLSFFRYICALIILSTWWLNKHKHFVLSAHIILIFSMLSVFQSAYYILGPDFGYQKYFIIFSVLPFLFFPKEMYWARILYTLSNSTLYFYLENYDYNYLFKTNVNFYNSSIATAFDHANLAIGFLTVFSTLIIYEYIILQDEKALRNALELAQYNANHDYLTKALNRKAMTDIINEKINFMESADKLFSVIMFDIDNFKNINDSYGHLTGDDILYKLSFLIQEKYGHQLTFSRWGGEEFLIVIDSCNLDQCIKIAESIRKSIYDYDFAIKTPITISLGATIFMKQDTFSTLLSRVDKLMYQAKGNGKNRVEYIDPSLQ